MLTVGRKRPDSSPRGDTQGICSYCGAQWYVSQMRKDRAGLWACPNDQGGRDIVTLTEGNARGAQKQAPPLAPQGPGMDDTSHLNTTAVHRTTVP
jgi:hypothetical protein